MEEKIDKGVLVGPDGNIIKSGGSWIIALPPKWIKIMNIQEATPCRIFQNGENQLILEVENENLPKSERD